MFILLRGASAAPLSCGMTLTSRCRERPLHLLPPQVFKFMYNKVVEKHYRLVPLCALNLETNAAAPAIPCTPHAALAAPQPLFAAF
jgi:hypothetical protein